MKSYLISILKDKSPFNNRPLHSIRIDDVSEDYFKGVIFTLEMLFKSENVISTEIKKNGKS